MKSVIILIYLLFSLQALAQNSMPTTPLLQPQHLQEDFALLYQQLQLNHPKLYATISKEEADRQFEMINAQIKEPMDRLAFFRLLAPFISLFKDGHTSVFFGLESAEFKGYTQNGGTFFPLEVAILNNKLYCKDNPFLKGSISKGDEIIRINDEPAHKLIARLQTLVAADGEAFAQASVQRLFGYLLWLDGHTKASSPVVYTKGTKQYQEVLQGIPNTDLQYLLFSAVRRPFQLQLHPESSLAVVQINTYGNVAKAKAFIDSSFQEIKAAGMQHVALDLRNNGGGSSVVGDYFLAHITRKPYSTIRTKSWRQGPLVLQKDSTFWIRRVLAEAKKTHTQEGEYLHSPIYGPEEPEPISDSLFTPARLFLLTSARTYSSAHMTALAVKCGELGTIVGRPTGERLDLTGETISYRLPHSNLSVDIPVASYTTACGNGAQVGVQPDYTVIPTAEDLRLGRDPEVDFIKALIKKGNTSAQN